MGKFAARITRAFLPPLIIFVPLALLILLVDGPSSGRWAEYFVSDLTTYALIPAGVFFAILIAEELIRSMRRKLALSEGHDENENEVRIDEVMRWTNPFGFKGRIGRAQFWLTMIVASIIQFPLMFYPVKHHHLVLSSHGGWGKSYIDYATAIEPITAHSWALLAGFYLIVAVLFWITISAMVQRLHDLGRSGKWVLAVVGALAVVLVLDAIFSCPGRPISTLEIAEMIFLAPFCFIGAWGMFEMSFMRGYWSWYDSLPADDLRRRT